MLKEETKILMPRVFFVEIWTDTAKLRSRSKLHPKNRELDNFQKTGLRFNFTDPLPHILSICNPTDLQTSGSLLCIAVRWSANKIGSPMSATRSKQASGRAKNKIKTHLSHHAPPLPLPSSTNPTPSPYPSSFLYPKQTAQPSSSPPSYASFASSLPRRIRASARREPRRPPASPHTAPPCRRPTWHHRGRKAAMIEKASSRRAWRACRRVLRGCGGRPCRCR